MSLNKGKCRPIPTFSHSSTLFRVKQTKIACFNGPLIHSPAVSEQGVAGVGDSPPSPHRRGFISIPSRASVAGCRNIERGENRLEERL